MRRGIAMWSWVITAVTDFDTVFKICSRYRFARSQDAHLHLKDHYEEVWNILIENGGTGMSDIELVWERNDEQYDGYLLN